jgi:hypothetical protein
MLEAVRTSETSVNFYETARRNIPEVAHLHGILRIEPAYKLMTVLFYVVLLLYLSLGLLSKETRAWQCQ